MYSSQLSNFQLVFLMSFFIYLLFDFLPLTPRGCATALVGKYVPNFYQWVFGFSYQAAQVTSLA